jgi:hypothetical protein
MSIHHQSDIRERFLGLLAMGSERAVADMAVDAIEGDQERFDAVLAICFSEPYPVCMRAARVIQLCCKHKPWLIYARLEETFDKVMASSVDGVKRNFLKIFAEFVPPGMFGDPGKLLSYAFDLLVDASEKPATRIQCMKIIEKISASEPEIRRELRESLLFLADDPLPSFSNFARKMLGRI